MIMMGRPENKKVVCPRCGEPTGRFVYCEFKVICTDCRTVGYGLTICGSCNKEGRIVPLEPNEMIPTNELCDRCRLHGEQ